MSTLRADVQRDSGILRRLYRRHLAKYRWGRWLKNAYAASRATAIEFRNRAAWIVLPWTSRLRLLAYTRLQITARALLEISGRGGLTSLARATCQTLSTLAESSSRLLVHNASFFRLVSYSEFLARGGRVHHLYSEEAVSLTLPTVYPERLRDHLHQGSWPLRIPALYAFEVPDAVVMGRSDLVYSGGDCLHHGLYNFSRDHLMEEMHGFVSVNARRKAIVRFAGKRVSASIPEAISLVGSVTSNYVHWLTETAPKLALLVNRDILERAPLILDSGLHPNILESVRLLNLGGRPIIELGPSERLQVGKLVSVSPVAYVPFEFKKGIQMRMLDIDPSFALYSPVALQSLREQLVRRVTGQSPDKICGTRRLYLRRSARSRQMANATEVEALVANLGFEIVEPDGLSFRAQVELFSDAAVVLGQGGAAFGNVVFAPPGCHVVVLSTWSPYTIYYYFSNISSVLHQRCSLLLCEPVLDTEGPHRAHFGLHVPIETLRQVLLS